MHYEGELGQNRGRDPDSHQNLVDCFLRHDPPLQNFHQNSFITFEIFCTHTHTHTHTHTQTYRIIDTENITFSAEVNMCLLNYLLTYLLTY